MKKALLVTSDFPPIVSGISTYYLHLYEQLDPDSFVVLAPWQPGCQELDRKNRFRTYRMKVSVGQTVFAKAQRMVWLNLYALFIVFKERIRTFHCGQVLSVGLLAFLLRKLCGLPYYVYVFGGDGETLRRFGPVRWLITFLMNNAAASITVSEASKREFLELGADSERLAVVYPGVDARRFSPGPRDREVVRKHNLAGKKVILTVARLGVIKGHDLVIQSLPELAKRVDNFVYLIAGSGPEGPRLKELVATLGLEDKVVFAGYVPDDDLPAYYRTCDVFIMTSVQIENRDVEGFGIVYIEANACGKPVIGSRSGGISEAVEEGVSGLLVEPNNQEQIVDALAKLFDGNGFAKEMGSRGRRRAEERFSWEQNAKELLRVVS